MLFGREPKNPASEELISAALATERTNSSSDTGIDLLEQFFAHNISLNVTIGMIVAAGDPTDMQILLNRAPNLRVAPGILEAVTPTFDQGEKLVPLLLAHDESTIPPQTLLSASYKSATSHTAEYFALLFNRNPHIELTPNLLEAVVKGYRFAESWPGIPLKRQLAELFCEHRKTVAFMDAIREAIDDIFKNDPDVRDLYLSLEDVTTEGLAT